MCLPDRFGTKKCPLDTAPKPSTLPKCSALREFVAPHGAPGLTCRAVEGAEAARTALLTEHLRLLGIAEAQGALVEDRVDKLEDSLVPCT